MSLSLLSVIILTVHIIHISGQLSQATQSAISLRISPFASSVNQPAHQQFVLTCKGFGAEPNLFTDLKWWDPRGQEITNAYTKYTNPDLKVEELLQTGGTLLHFLNPLPDNSGQYRCSATFQHSDSFEAKIQINFFQDVKWEDCPAIQSLILDNTNERIRCKASANPKPNIDWSKDDKPLNNDRRYQIDSNGIAINDVTRQSDGGVYRVRALVTETGQLHDQYITVQVYVRPTIVNLPGHFEGTEHEEATLKCEASGVPEPMYTWLDPNKRNLSSVGGYAVDRNGGALIISRVKQMADNGSFTCIAENFAGIAQQSTRLVVLRRPVINAFHNQSYDVNKEARLECRAAGEPRPRLTIRRDGDSRELQSGDPRIAFEEKMDSNGETVLILILTQTTRSDDGLYFCRAENRGGIVERVGHLEVRFAPDLRRTPLTSVRHWDLHPINMTCIADAIPNATIKWWYRGVDLTGPYAQNTIYTIEDNSAGTSRLHINARASPGTAQRDIYGQYRCQAINSLGTAEVVISLDQAFRPGAVLQVTHEKVTPTTILFRAMTPSFDGGLPISAMHVHWRREDDHTQQMQQKKWPINKRDQTYFMDGLWPRTRYLFRFAAENDVGIGDFSTDRVVLTERESRPEKPDFHNLPLNSQQEIVSPFPDQFAAQWTLPPDNGRPIKYFQIKYYSVRKSDVGYNAIGFDERIASVSMTDQSMTSYTLHDLRPDTYYRIELRAYNDLGYSDIQYLVFKTAYPYDTFTRGPDPTLSTSSVSLSLIIGCVIAVVVVLLILTDVYFCLSHRVGAIHFLASNVFSADSTAVATDAHKTKSSDGSLHFTAAPYGRTGTHAMDNPGFGTVTERQLSVDDQNEPFIGSTATERQSNRDRVTQQLSSFRAKDSAV